MSMNRFRFSIAGLLIMTAIVAVSVNPVAEYFGWQHPREVHRVISFIDSLEDSISYEDFISEMKLGEMQERPDPPSLGGYEPNYMGGYWELNDGYTVNVDFGSDEMLLNATIWTGGKNRFYLWGWTRGDRTKKDAFEKQMQRFKRP